jgi:hypothetical protein
MLIYLKKNAYSQGKQVLESLTYCYNYEILFFWNGEESELVSIT